MVSREARWVPGLATERGVNKRDGRSAEAVPACGCSNHEEVEAQEGKVGHQGTNAALKKSTNFHEDESPEDDKRRRAETS